MNNEKTSIQSRSINPFALPRRSYLYRHALWIAVCVCLCGHLPALCQEQGRLSTDPQKRIDQLADAFAKLPESQGDVLALLADEDLGVTSETLRQLTNQENLPQAVRKSVAKLTASQDSETRILAIGCLAHSRIADRAEIDDITRALSDPVATVRLAAIEATPMVDVSQKCTIENLLATLDDPDASVQLGAIKVLPKIKCNQSASVPVLARLSEKSPSSQVRTSALAALGDLTAKIDETTDVLLSLALKDKDADVRREAVRALQNVKSLRAQQTSSLSLLTQDPSSKVRQTAAYTLITLGRDQPQAAEMVATLQNDPDEGVRDAVAFALRYGQMEKPVFSLVAKSLNDPSMEVRLDAVDSLLKLKGQEDVPPDEDPGPSHFALSAYEIWPKDLTDASLKALSQSESALLREDMANAIRRFGVYDKALMNRLSELATTDADEWSRRASVRALSNALSTPDTLNVLIAATRDSDAIVRGQAVTGLGKLSFESWPLFEPQKAATALGDIEDALATRLEDKALGVRLSAFRALDHLFSGSDLSSSTLPKSTTTRTRVTRGLKEENPQIREAAAKALGSLGLGENDIAVLVTSLRDDNFGVGVQAAKSLANIDFSNDRVKQSVGLMPITPLDFTTPEAVVATTTRDLRRVAPKCRAIDAIMSSLSTFRGSELYLEELQSLANIAARANSMVDALQDGELPPNSEFVKAAGAAVDDCAPSIQKAERFFVQQMDTPDPRARAVVAAAVGSLRLQGPDIVSAIGQLCSDGSREVRKAAVSALPGVVGNDDADGIITAANKLGAATIDSDSDVRLAAVESLVELKARDILAESYRNPDPAVRKAIMQGYTSMRTPASDIEALVKDGLRDRERPVRLQTLSYLSTQGNSAYDLLKDVVPLLSDRNAEIRAEAAVLFGYYRADAAFAVPDVQHLLTDEDSAVKSAAADSLGWIGPSAHESVNGLISLLSDEGVGPHAKLALRRIGNAAIPQLTSAAQSSADENQTERVADVLESIKAGKSQRLFRVTLKDGNQQTIDMQSGIVIAVATWCPYSQKLRDFLVRDDVKPYFKGITFYFLLEEETNTVMAHVKDELRHHKEWTEQRKKEVLDEVRKKVAAGGYYDPSFLKTLPGEQFQVMALSKLAIPLFPTVLIPSGVAASPENLTKESWLSVRDWANSDWFSEHINMPDAMYSELKSISGSGLFF